MAYEPARHRRQLSTAARMVYTAYRRGPAPSRELRRTLPRVLSRREYARAWRELAELGLVPGSSAA